MKRVNGRPKNPPPPPGYDAHFLRLVDSLPRKQLILLMGITRDTLHVLLRGERHPSPRVVARVLAWK